jgi:SAM-dependent methyltransferase
VKVCYDHSQEVHSLEGPSAALPIIFSDYHPKSLLDVGCGVGTWLAAAARLGWPDLLGLDGVDIPEEQLFISRDHFRCQNLTEAWNLDRRFDAALCLEVAEHLEEDHADKLLDGLIRHADLIIFSAACPGQPGLHHVNCQWPSYWQEKFNQRGYICKDEVRWKIWEVPNIEWWYRQNMFIAQRAPYQAGLESRLRPVIHPEMLKFMLQTHAFENHVHQIECGRMPISWYLTVPGRAILRKIGQG